DRTRHLHDRLRRWIRRWPGKDRRVAVELALGRVHKGQDAVAVVGQRTGGKRRVVVCSGGYPCAGEDHVRCLSAWVQSLEGERVQRLWRGLTRSDAAVGAEPSVEVPRDAREECGRPHEADVELGEVEDLDAAQAD